MPATRIKPSSQSCIHIFQITRTYKILKSKLGIKICHNSFKNIVSAQEISFSVVKIFAGGSGPPPPSSHIADKHTTVVKCKKNFSGKVDESEEQFDLAQKAAGLDVAK